MGIIQIYTIGFTKIGAEDFFSEIKSSGCARLIDVRLNNVSQLSGFAKKDDLKYFLKEICGVEYEHNINLAPTESMLNQYKKKQCSWDTYAQNFIQLIRERKIEKILSPSLMDQSCLLCSEDTPHFCHRRLVAEYLKEKWEKVEVIHLHSK